MARDRRWDYLYDREKQPVRDYVLERFAGEVADELRAWPPGDLEWAGEAERARWGAGAERPPREAVVREALAVARLDLLREFEALEQRAAALDHPARGPGEREALHLLVVLLTERCLELKERADKMRLTRADLARGLDLVEAKLYRVTLS